MSSRRLLFLSAIIFGCSGPSTQQTHARPSTVPDAVQGGEQFKHRVAAAYGDTELQTGDSIVIDEVRGTAASFELGATYRIAGRYRLGSAERAMLLASVTVVSGRGVSTPSPSSHVDLARGAGEFVLELTLATPGYPHLTFYAPDGHPIGGVYFGANEWLLAKKGWSYLGPTPERQPPDPAERSFELL